MAQKPKKTDLGAGLRISKDNVEPHPAGPPKHGELSQAERAFTLASTFLSGCLAISASQFLGAPLKLIDPAFYDGYMAYTKESFAVLITCLTQWWAPTVVRVSGDESMRGQLIQMKDGSLKSNFADRMILMANHQLYTDWMYLWWIAYTNGMHGYIYIILKESLKNIPILGWGAQFYNFIFLARNWEKDKPQFKRHLQKLNKPKDPMWLLIFPEGTNLAKSTRESSKRWADKNGLKDMKHQLLPRSTGLRFCLQELEETTQWLYDCTIAYEGVPPGQFGQDIFTLRSSFFEGRPPKSMNMHWRRFHINSIPINHPKAFDVWLRNRWREKDYMLEYFTHNSRFPADDFWKEQLDLSETSSSSQSIRSVPRGARTIETQVKSGNWNEFVKIFAPITSVIMALTLAYGASPNDLPIPGGTEFIQQHMSALLGAGDAATKGPPGPEEMDRLIEAAAKASAAQTAEPQNQGQVQKLTQEHLAQLVKETAIQNGTVLPNGKKKAMSTPNSRPSAVTRKSAPVMATVKAPSIPKPLNASTSKPTIKLLSKPAASTVKKSPPSSGEVHTVMTKEGVPIQVTKSEADNAKNGSTVMTKSGVSIHVTPSVPEKAAQKNTIPGSQNPTIKPAATPANHKTTPQKPIIKQATQSKPATQQLESQKTPAKKAVPNQKAPTKPAGTSQVNGVTPKKAPVANSASVKKPVASGPQKIPAPKQTPKKLST